MEGGTSDVGIDGGKALAQRMGVDITAVARLEALARRRPGALKRLFTAGEVKDAGRGRQFWPRLASRFAAKEALVKASGGLRGSSYQDIDIRRRPGQSPLISVSGPLGDWLAAEKLSVSLSLSHEDQFAVAMVLLVPREDGDGGP